MNYKFTLYKVVTLTAGVCLFLSFAGCSKHSNSPGTNLKDTGSVRGVLGGVPFQTVQDSIVATVGNDSVHITAYLYKNDVGSQVQLIFPDTLSVNTPYVDTTGRSLVIYYLNTETDPQEVYGSGSEYSADTLTLTSFNKTLHTISGTFTGPVYLGRSLAEPAVRLSNGYFSTSYTSNPQ
jgi:hypothetical protein